MGAPPDVAPIRKHWRGTALGGGREDTDYSAVIWGGKERWVGVERDIREVHCNGK